MSGIANDQYCNIESITADRSAPVENDENVIVLMMFLRIDMVLSSGDS